jgi:hypothetical protein
VQVVFERPSVWFSRKASKELKSLKPVFEELSRVHEHYTNAEPSNDFSFWYTERSQIGLLAAAAYLCGGTAMEEYACKKENRKKRCRADLYIRRRNAAFECEAKHVTLNLGKTSAELVRSAEKHLDKAAEEANRLRDADHRLGLCFLTPWINESQPDPDGRCRQVIDGLNPANGRSNCDALVWIHGRRPVPRNDKKRLYAGLLLAVKEATKAGKAR